MIRTLGFRLLLKTGSKPTFRGGLRRFYIIDAKLLNGKPTFTTNSGNDYSRIL